MAGGERAEHVAEFPRIPLAVVRRNHHSDQHHARLARRAPVRSTRRRFSRLVASGRPRNPSFPPSSMITIVGLVQLEHARQPGKSALRGFAADAGVDHLVSVPFGGEPLRKQRHPAFLNLDAVSGAETVAKHDDGAGRGAFGSGGPDPHEDQYQLNESDERTQSRKPHKKGYQPGRDADHRGRCFVGHRGG